MNVQEQIETITLTSSRSLEALRETNYPFSDRGAHPFAKRSSVLRLTVSRGMFVNSESDRKFVGCRSMRCSPDFSSS